eukprot:g7583.t1
MAQTDRDALNALYHATDGPRWWKSTNWNTDAALSEWHGVVLNDEGRVKQLKLDANNLRGTIPEELGELAALEYLYLSRNQLTGTIPGELGELAALEYLYLSGNQLTGTIPGELGKLAALKGLYLSRNQLSGTIPGELGELAALQHLDLSQNQLTGTIPEKLGKLAALQKLFLWGNQLIGTIPEELGKLAALQHLDLSGNQLTGTIPGELGELAALQRLDLSGNQLTGTIPGELGKLAALQRLDLSQNQLTGTIPGELGKLAALESLYLWGNQLTGTIPRELGELAALESLYLSQNQLTGTIPGELGELAALESLYLSQNQLTGTIPGELGKLAALQNLYLWGNQLTALWDTLGQQQARSMATPRGTIPAALATLLDLFERIDYFLQLSQNPWEHPPEPIVANGVPAMREFFEAVYRGGTTPVSRPLKLVIVGKETVGKTSLRCSITSGKPSKTKERGEESTVHVDVEDSKIDDHRIRIFDCAGQVVYYGLLQLFLTRRAVYLLVWDAEDANEMVWEAENASNLESLAIAPWLRHLTFRVPDANVVLVGNKWDLVRSRHNVASEVERQSREWLASWTEKAHGRQPHGLLLEDGVSLVSCAPPAPAFGGGRGWPCDMNKPGLFRRITHDADGNKRALTMHLPPSYLLALEELEKLASCSRRKVDPGITREKLMEKWQDKVEELKVAGKPVADPDPEAAMSGAVLIRKWEGGLVEYGSYIFLDVQWFATVLDPLFCHKRDSFGNLDLGGRPVTNARSLRRLEDENVLEPELAEDLWGPELAPHLLLALKSAGLTFPLPKDPRRGLVILLRMGTEPPDDYERRLRIQLGQADQAGKHDLVLHAECSFSLGLPPGFVERLLARCCHLGSTYPFWRYGALIVGEGVEEGLFSLSLGYSEENNTLTVKAYGGCTKVHVWGALSKVLSVLIKMLAEFPGLPCEPTFFCPLHNDKGMPISKNARPGNPLVEGSFCQLCKEQTAGKGLLAVALQVVKVSDENFLDAELRRQFAERAENVARWPGSNIEISGPTSVQIRPGNQSSLQPTPSSPISGRAPVQIRPGNQASLQPSPNNPDQRTPCYQDLRTWVAAAFAACITIFGVFAGKEDDDARVWGVFLGLAMLLGVVELVLIARVNRRLCFALKGEAANAGIGPGVATGV